MQDYYVDRLGNMTVQGSVARLEFMRMDSFDPEKKEAKLSPSLSLVMPIASLLQLSDALNKMCGQLEKSASEKL